MQFGIIATIDDNIWKHALALMPIDRTGRIVPRIDGSTWEAEDFQHACDRLFKESEI